MGEKYVLAGKFRLFPSPGISSQPKRGNDGRKGFLPLEEEKVDFTFDFRD